MSAGDIAASGRAGGNGAQGPRARLATDPPEDGESSDEADRVLHQVKAVLDDLAEGLVPNGVTMQTDLKREFGLDSLAVVELCDRLESVFEVELDDNVMRTAATPEDWLLAIRRARTGSTGARGDWRPRSPTRRPLGEACPPSIGTLTGALAWQVDHHPDLVCIRLLTAEEGTASEEVTYRMLAEGATALAQGLIHSGISVGDRVAIMLPSSRSYFEAFLGVMLAGGIPVPLYPPVNEASFAEHVGREAQRLNNAGAALLVAEVGVGTADPEWRNQLPSLQVLSVTQLAEPRGSSLPLRFPSSTDIALIQYTSGSTSAPKGVVLTHTQVLANIQSLGTALSVVPDDVFVSWLPLYHDMGLIGAWLATMFFGIPVVLMSPLQFLVRPVRWFRAISDYHGTLSGAPNFAFQTCIDRINDDELAGIDLSGWRVAFNGSEPVSESTIHGFVDRFARVGFRPSSMCPAYGLAEVGVGLTVSPPGRGPKIECLDRLALQSRGEAQVVGSGESQRGRSVVGCGPVIPGYQFRVTDEDGREEPDGWEGRVQCRGPSATAGYFANPSATESLWRNGWLETGDLGYRREGELFITGRVKDLIIRHGRNLHPEDLEQALRELPDMHHLGVAVISAAEPQRGTERIVIVAESTLESADDRDGMRSAIRRVAVDVLGSAPDQILLVPPGSIPRTANLKVRRAATRQLYEEGALSGAAPTTSAASRIGRAAGNRPTRPIRTRPLRGLVTGWAFSCYAWALTGLIGAPLWVAVQAPISDRLRWRLVRAAARTLVALCRFDVRVTGGGSLVPGPAVVIANHDSFVDALAIVLAVPAPLVFTTSTEMKRSRLFGPFLRRLGCVFVHRGEADKSAGDVEEMARRVRSGDRLVVFPEGGLDPTPGLRTFHLGAFAVAVRAQCPVIPIGIRGTREVVAPGTYRPHRHGVELGVGFPITPDGDDFRTQVKLRDRGRSSIGEILAGTGPP